MLNVKIIFYNCGGIRSNPDFINDLLAKTDILFLQETMLSEANNDFLRNFDEDFTYCFKNGKRNDEVFCGRASGGLAIFWRTQLNHCISEFKTTCERINAIVINDRDNKKFLFLNCYLPCDYGSNESLLQYEECLSDMELIMNDDSEIFEEVVMVGDFNCDSSKGRFFNYFNNMINIYDLSIVDIERLSPDSFTYVSRRDCCATSWLDHVVSSNPNSISNLEILYGQSVEDHIPVYFSYKLHNFIAINVERDESQFTYVLWNKVSKFEIEKYATTLDYFLSEFYTEAFSCSARNCSNVKHKKLIQEAFQYLCNSILAASEHFPVKNKKKHKLVTGWNDFCRSLHEKARMDFLKWNEEGRIRTGHVFEQMKASRRDFKRSLQFCKQNELKLKKQKLVESFKHGSKVKFWKEVKNITKNNDSPIQCVDGRTTSDEILHVFKSKYQSVLDDKKCQGKSETYARSIEELNNRDHVNNCMIFKNYVVEAVRSLNDGIGFDSIHSNFFKFADHEFFAFVARLFSSFLSHSYVPKEILFGEIRPIVKNGKGSKTDSANYRPVMSSSNFLKIFEYCLLPWLKKHLKITPVQFGYRPKTGCLTANIVFRETILNYTSRNSNVHAAVLDMSKAFDRINPNILIEKLINDSDLPSPIIRILKFMNENQMVWIGLNGRRGEKWQIKNGTRQGGVLSGLLFNFYINDMLETVRQLDVGCSLRSIKFNIIGYADDIMILCPSANGLQFLIDKLYLMLSSLCLEVNVDKSVYLIFRRKRNIKTKFNNVVSLCNKPLKIVKETKYLGIIISDSMLINKDIVRCCNSFKKQFHSMMARFGFMNMDILTFLFTSYCSSMYGAELWSVRSGSRSDFDHFGVIYHRAVKRIAGLSGWDSNHLACRIASLPIFKHLINKKVLNFYFRILNSNSPCLSGLRNYFRFHSHIKYDLCNIFNDIYLVKDIFNNDLIALQSRIDFVQRNE